MKLQKLCLILIPFIVFIGFQNCGKFRLDQAGSERISSSLTEPSVPEEIETGQTVENQISISVSEDNGSLSIDDSVTSLFVEIKRFDEFVGRIDEDDLVKEIMSFQKRGHLEIQFQIRYSIVQDNFKSNIGLFWYRPGDEIEVANFSGNFRSEKYLYSTHMGMDPDSIGAFTGFSGPTEDLLAQPLTNIQVFAVLKGFIGPDQQVTKDFFLGEQTIDLSNKFRVVEKPSEVPGTEFSVSDLKLNKMDSGALELKGDIHFSGFDQVQNKLRTLLSEKTKELAYENPRLEAQFYLSTKEYYDNAYVYLNSEVSNTAPLGWSGIISDQQVLSGSFQKGVSEDGKTLLFKQSRLSLYKPYWGAGQKYRAFLVVRVYGCSSVCKLDEDEVIGELYLGEATFSMPQFKEAL